MKSPRAFFVLEKSLNLVNSRLYAAFIAACMLVNSKGVGGAHPKMWRGGGERLGHDFGSGEGPLSQERKRSAVTMTVVSSACPCPE